jgi:hypothetical protein
LAPVERGPETRFWALGMGLTDGQNKAKPRVKKVSKAHEKSH